MKKEPLIQVFSCEFCEISKNIFFTEHLSTTASVLSEHLQKNGKIVSIVFYLKVFFGNIHPKICNFLLLAPVGNIILFLTQGTFDGSSNATTAI